MYRPVRRSAIRMSMVEIRVETLCTLATTASVAPLFRATASQQSPHS